MLGHLIHLLPGVCSTPALFSLRFSQSLALLLCVRLRRRRPLSLCFQFGRIFNIVLLRQLRLLLGLNQLLPQLRLELFVLRQVGFHLSPPFSTDGSFQFSLQSLLGFLALGEFGFQLTPTLEGINGQSFHRFAPFGLPRQGLGQGLDLLLHRHLGRLQFIGPCLQFGLLGNVFLVQRLCLPLDLLQLLPQPRLDLFAFGQLSFQFTPSFPDLASLLLGALATLALFG